ncbi:glycosyltransferase family 1 protein [Candidatus Woesearchaeota archaeon]|nr:glycosyltransferase family 1 protein [Candidatus Woesearchaeota archaeon]
MKVAFHCNQLGIAGTEVATYDYAKYNEEYLGNESIIVSKRNPDWDHPQAVEKFSKRFKLFQYDTFEEVDPYLDKEKVDTFYALKSGGNDGIISKGRKNCMHVVFRDFQPHGNVYAMISPWLSTQIFPAIFPWVPHMINLPDEDRDMREELNIPKDATVFGRYGSYNEFNITFVYSVIEQILNERRDVWFIFANTPEFIKHERVIFLPGIYDMSKKTQFINTSDAMIHARQRGETFGIACGEFSIRNKAVITFGLSPEKAHLDILGDKGLIYNNKSDLIRIFRNFDRNSGKNWDAYSLNYSMKPTMDKFKKVFL